MDLIKKFMEIGGFRTREELEAYGEKNFFNDYPEARQYAKGGAIEAYPQIATFDKAFSYGVKPGPQYLAGGGSAFPQAQTEAQFFIPIYTDVANPYNKAYGGSNLEMYPNAKKTPHWGPTNVWFQDGGQNQAQELVQNIAQALQQGMDPKEIVAKLTQMGIQQDKAMQAVQMVIQQMQQMQQQPAQEQPMPDQGMPEQPMMEEGGNTDIPTPGGKRLKYLVNTTRNAAEIALQDKITKKVTGSFKDGGLTKYQGSNPNQGSQTPKYLTQEELDLAKSFNINDPGFDPEGTRRKIKQLQRENWIDQQMQGKDYLRVDDLNKWWEGVNKNNKQLYGPGPQGPPAYSANYPYSYGPGYRPGQPLYWNPGMIAEYPLGPYGYPSYPQPQFDMRQLPLDLYAYNMNNSFPGSNLKTKFSIDGKRAGSFYSNMPLIKAMFPEAYGRGNFEDLMKNNADFKNRADAMGLSEYYEPTGLGKLFGKRRYIFNSSVPISNSDLPSVQDPGPKPKDPQSSNMSVNDLIKMIDLIPSQSPGTAPSASQTPITPVNVSPNNITNTYPSNTTGNLPGNVVPPPGAPAVVPPVSPKVPSVSPPVAPKPSGASTVTGQFSSEDTINNVINNESKYYRTRPANPNDPQFNNGSFDPMNWQSQVPYGHTYTPEEVDNEFLKPDKQKIERAYSGVPDPLKDIAIDQAFNSSFDPRVAALAAAGAIDWKDRVNYYGADNAALLEDTWNKNKGLINQQYNDDPQAFTESVSAYRDMTYQRARTKDGDIPQRMPMRNYKGEEEKILVPGLQYPAWHGRTQATQDFIDQKYFDPNKGYVSPYKHGGALPKAQFANRKFSNDPILSPDVNSNQQVEVQGDWTSPITWDSSGISNNIPTFNDMVAAGVYEKPIEMDLESEPLSKKFQLDLKEGKDWKSMYSFIPAQMIKEGTVGAYSNDAYQMRKKGMNDPDAVARQQAELLYSANPYNKGLVAINTQENLGPFGQRSITLRDNYGMKRKNGGDVKKNDVVYWDEDTIREFIANGGQVEYLD